MEPLSLALLWVTALCRWWRVTVKLFLFLVWLTFATVAYLIDPTVVPGGMDMVGIGRGLEFVSELAGLDSMQCQAEGLCTNACMSQLPTQIYAALCR